METTVKFRSRIFQLTHSRGVRHVAELIATAEKNFNSRTHVECDAEQG